MLKIITAVAIVVLIIGASMYFWQKPEKESFQEETEDSVEAWKYTNKEFGFSFDLPSQDWEIKEERVGGDLGNQLRVNISEPSFVDETFGEKTDVVSISVIDQDFNDAYSNMNENLSKETEKNITVAGITAIQRAGKNEFGGTLIVTIVPFGDKTIIFFLGTDKEPYASQFDELLDSFEIVDQTNQKTQ
ncbi:MAG: hypothetical protein ACD_76C00045G0011 [uncultured bacterium]|nr:MAG: hypothetical protein ACD_76C00045G0011 [uncultured bacterium]